MSKVILKTLLGLIIIISIVVRLPFLILVIITLALDVCYQTAEKDVSQHDSFWTKALLKFVFWPTDISDEWGKFGDWPYF